MSDANNENNESNELIELLSRVATALEAAAPAPDFTYPLAAFWRFDWDSIGAVVEATDKHGATVVRWGGRLYSRKSPSNKFTVAIWYSRPLKGEGGGYEWLVTFRDPDEVDPLPHKTVAALKAAVAAARGG